jgi:iron uptake system component EfeO
MKIRLTWTGAFGATTALLGAVALSACGDEESAGKGNASTVKVTLTDAGCSPTKLNATAGPTTFTIENPGSSKVSEMELKSPDGIILGERENIAAGLSGSFSLTLKAGRYVMSCPNGDSEDNGTLIVTGTAPSTANAASPALLRAATDGYRDYVRRESAAMLAGVTAFTTALEKGETDRAKALYGPVRRHYEAIEPVAESFGDLDPKIDARVNDVPNVKDWTGFHRIEQILWTKDTTDGTEPYAKQLLADTETLDRKVQSLTYQAPQLANGAVELLNEVANGKITGEEDRYSHTDLSDFQGNLEGAHEAFEQLRPALEANGNGVLAKQIAARFATVQSGLDGYRRNTPLGFAYYQSLTPADRLRFAQQVDALAEPLSTVAARVAG